jgi:hypothetical protein
MVFPNIVRLPIIGSSLWPFGEDNGFPEGKFAKVKDIISKADVDSKSKWLDKLQRGASDVMISILLSQFIEPWTLELELGWYEDKRPFVNTVFRQALNSASSSSLGPTKFDF